MVNENRTYEARENMDQNGIRKYDENALNIYELDSFDTK